MVDSVCPCYNHKNQNHNHENNNILKHNNNNYHIYKIINGRIYTDYVENVAIIQKNKVLDKVSYQQVDGELKSSKFNSSIYKGTPYFKKKINGSVLCLTQGASGHNNYFHWLFDILPKIKIYSEKYDLNTLDYFYLSRLKEFQKSSIPVNLKNVAWNMDRYFAGSSQRPHYYHPPTWADGGGDFIFIPKKNIQ